MSMVTVWLVLSHVDSARGSTPTCSTGYGEYHRFESCNGIMHMGKWVHMDTDSTSMEGIGLPTEKTYVAPVTWVGVGLPTVGPTIRSLSTHTPLHIFVSVVALQNLLTIGLLPVPYAYMPPYMFAPHSGFH